MNDQLTDFETYFDSLNFDYDKTSHLSVQVKLDELKEAVRYAELIQKQVTSYYADKLKFLQNVQNNLSIENSSHFNATCKSIQYDLCYELLRRFEHDYKDLNSKDQLTIHMHKAARLLTLIETVNDSNLNKSRRMVQDDYDKTCELLKAF